MTVLTANQRLARDLRHRHNAAQRARGLAAWTTPDILPLARWIERCYESAGEERPVLSKWQECAIWESVIESSTPDLPLLDAAATARAASDTWALVRAWRIPLDHPDWERSEDSLVFSQWAAEFLARLERNSWLDSAALADYIAPPPPVSLDLAGFDELTPQQSALIGRLRAAGSGIRMVQPAQGSASNAVRRGYPDTEAELTAAALWARAMLEERRRDIVGIVVPRLQALRSQADRILKYALNDDSAYHISLGVSLADTPAVHAALLLLEASSGRIDLVRAGSLLRSAFTKGGESESARRATLDAKLRRRGELEVSVKDLPWPLEQPRGKKLPGAWAAWFSAALETAGWPGDRKLSSAEYQTVQRWHTALSEFAALDAFASPLTFHAALSRVRSIVAETVFQPEAETAPIQLLGALEAAGSEFDALWITGLHDGVWPSPARPDPFIPIALQREMGLPHSNAARELAFASRTTDRLLRCAPEVIVSYPMQQGEERLRPSPLILHLPESERREQTQESYVGRIQRSAIEEEIGDNTAPQPDEAELQRGGTRIFKLQAACPFRAFAEVRLNATALEAGVPGLDPIGRGELVHKMLEYFWRAVPSQEALRNFTPWELEAAIGAAVNTAVEIVRRDGPDSDRFWRIEGQRVAALLRNWISDVELMRPPFQVEQPEAEQFAELGGIRFKTRLDRIDRTADGKTILIDYKTGVPNINSWQGERLAEPQLPLYAVTQSAPPGAIAFAQIRRGDSCFKGLAASGGLIPRVEAADDWAGKLAEWRNTLTNIAAAYRRGEAAVDPAKSNTCDFCKLPSLCRIGPATE